MNIIIPSAKIVPEELQSLGKLPAVIYPVNQNLELTSIPTNNVDNWLIFIMTITSFPIWTCGV